MKKSIELVLTSKEAIELLTHPATTKKMHTKIIAAMRDGTTYPKGALAAATAQAKKPLAQKKPAAAKESAATQ